MNEQLENKEQVNPNQLSLFDIAPIEPTKVEVEVEVSTPERPIICRFDNQESIDTLAQKLPGFNNKVTEYDLDNKRVLKVKRKPGKKRPPNDKHDVATNWVGMPAYQSKKIEAYHKVIFKTDKDEKELAEILEQNISTKTKSVWFPKLIPGLKGKYRALEGNASLRYPMYVVSKGRPNNCTTSVSLSAMEVPHYVVVEPFEVEIYKESLESVYATVLPLDMQFKEDYDVFSDIGGGNGTGPGAARNFVWEHSKGNGFKRHWVMDDNCTESFHILHQNFKIKARTGAYFAACEDFVDRYSNIDIAGLNYTKFCMETAKLPPYVLNTRIYSFLLIDNSIQERWRGRYNEDTDLSLRVLKRGGVTCQFNAFVAGKITTQKVKGGNTAEFYGKEGTMNKSKMLEDMHPDVCKVSWKFNRWHHECDYSGYNNKLIPIVDLKQFPKVNNYGIKIIETEEESTLNTKAFLENKYQDKLKNYVEPQFYDYE